MANISSYNIFLNKETFTYREGFAHNKLLHTKSFTHRKKKSRKKNTQRNFHNRNYSSKTGSRRQSEKNAILKKKNKRTLQWKLLAPKLRKFADKLLSHPWYSHSNTIYEIQLHKIIVLRMQPRHQATLIQSLQYDLQRLSCKK